MTIDRAGLAIMSGECERACKGEPNLESRFHKAMAVVAKDHWMYCGDHYEDLRFRSAIGGVLLSPETTDAEKEQIKKSITGLRVLSAVLNGVPVDMGAAFNQDDGIEALPLTKWWNEAKS